MQDLIPFIEQWPMWQYSTAVNGLVGQVPKVVLLFVRVCLGVNLFTALVPYSQSSLVFLTKVWEIFSYEGH